MQTQTQKLHKSKSNPSKLRLYIPCYNGSKIAPLSSRQFKNRSLSNTKIFGVRPGFRSPSSRQKQSKQKSAPKIQIQNLNFNVVICNKDHLLSSPTHNLTPKSSKFLINMKGGYFKSNKPRIINKYNQPQQRKKSQPAKFDFNPIKILAKGQYGNIYLAYSKQSNFLAVIKSFKKEKVTLQFMIDQFKIQMYCRHPHILPAYGCFFGKSQVYLIMEAGEFNLYHLIKHHGYLLQKKAATYIHQVLKGLAYLHLNGIIHRDLKPQNIIICGGIAKITDFGWSAITASQRKTYCGTLDYVSPEVSSGNKYDNKIDCWSIGVLAFQMLTGFPPFQLFKSNKDRPLLNYNVKPRIPQNLTQDAKTFIQRMLCVNPSERYSVAEALRDPWIKNNSEQLHKKQSNLFANSQNI